MFYLYQSCDLMLFLLFMVLNLHYKSLGPAVFFSFGGGGGSVGGSINPLKNRLHRTGGVFYYNFKRDSFRFPWLAILGKHCKIL